jgi:ABC-type antimicrobial peptide transport system permease subunit
MFKNYFKISYRYLIRNKGFSAVNILGLAIGMASAMLILLWVQNELGVDRFHKNTDRIYMAYRRLKINGEMYAGSQTPQVLAPALKQSYPEVDDAVRFNNVTFLVTVGEKHLNVRGAFADSGFLSVFSFPASEGNAGNALGPNKIVLTEKLAKKLFGNQSPVGKMVRIDSTNNFTVSAVLKDLPANTQFDFEYLLPWGYSTTLGWEDKNWTNNSTDTYVMLKPGASQLAFDAKVKAIIMQHAGKGYTTKVNVFTQPLSKLYLYSKSENGNLVGGKIEIVKLFSIIAVFILLIACINFMNLSTARSEKRAKEVGIRKVAGAHKNSLIAQFICESIMLAFAAFVIALAIVQFSLPAFNMLTGKQLSIDFGNIFYWLAAVLFTGFIAGSYPAFYLSSFVPVQVLKGSFKKVNAVVTPRKVLVVLQFTFAIILIISTIIVEHQIQYAQSRDAGFDRSNLVYTFNQGDVNKNFDIIKQELISSGTAISVSKSSSPITQRWNSGSGYVWNNSSDADQKTEFVRLGSDADFIKTMGATLLEGRDIDINKYPGDSTAMLLNETAVKLMHLKNPVGQIIKRQNYPDQWRVVGVVKDFILESPYENINPTMIIGPLYWNQVIHFRLNPAQPTAASIAKAEQIFKKYNPQYPFDYVFADESYAQKFAEEQRTGKLAGLFAGLSIFISCLGLFGLAAYMAEQRTKEIGIRKVLGASVQSVVALMSKDFVTLVLISVIIASPVAWLFMNQWLQNYTYRINISWWIFGAAGLIAVAIALATVSFQAIKAATANPVKSLRAK